ncbi:MAG: glycoside hydrolase family 2 TIM barrel-domain containing protein [Bacteroidota bacterium]|nr:glycoside hydrolase family 2 TIM barrel-domain containing protein [Bacteroidota bacterium]
MLKSLSFKIVMLCLSLLLFVQMNGQETQHLYLSGTGSDHTVNWQFFCTAGQNSGKWTTIPVPSNWELQGFGKYDYGWAKDTVRGKESGFYKYKFKVPSNWSEKTIDIVFEGSMTDTEVKINGKSAGPVHQGGYYCFKYDVTSLLKVGQNNLLEVNVAKHSANKSVNAAERIGDFWIYGGIFRPVYLEALPQQRINRIALDAKADGSFNVNVFLSKLSGADEVSAQIYTLDGKAFGAPFKTKISNGDSVAHLKTTVSSPKLWTSEFPTLYKVTFTLLQNGKAVHAVNQRFGFRTVELRQRDGIYVNGVKIKFKGVNYHAFWPNTGRATNKDISIADVKLMKDMNMNAVRMSHYPHDAHFYDVCDSLGLFVLDELAGWHGKYDTPTGTQLANEMVAFNENHPSIIIWDNGNEGGFNFDLDPVIDKADIQKRPVIHPWAIFRGADTHHYKDYNYGNGLHYQGHDVVFPTEFLHGIFDGGSGAALDDFWELMWRTPLSAGGFLWVFCDEGVVRTDKNGFIDNFGSYAPDGIVGPHREKEGSYFTIKEVWSPVYFEHREITSAFDGTFRLQNRYHYTNINQCSFSWKLAKMAGPYSKDAASIKTGTATAPDIQPGQFGTLSLQLPSDWKDYDVLYVTATDPHNQEIYTWSFPVKLPQQIAQRMVVSDGGPIDISEADSTCTVAANGVKVTFSRKTGLLIRVENGKGVIPFNNGPVICEGETDFKSMACHREGNDVVVENTYGKKSSFTVVKWTIMPSGWIKLDVKYCPVDEYSTFLGVSFSYPEKLVKGVRYLGNGPYRVWKNRMKGTTLNVWDKTYNNTVTGESQKLEYPEFKGYYSNMYWMKLETTEQPFVVVTENEDVFMRLFTPQSPKETFNVAPAFPSGDISFMHGITPIGTKGQKPVNLGPSGNKNMYYDYGRAQPKEMTLYFDFSGKE